ncbi:MAG: type II toxin-antitoxin system RelB/DinJ family antitoxin [Oscillospiraceae bacterium]|nr:type II toxin-antitoxin system RelB/DinJ family antitoxin [Candidatus Limimonas coprohippi]MCQ2461552.1 type II toxin-antitoxin system RelB/DinJ family antitoxin [Clostridia bacterium]
MANDINAATAPKTAIFQMRINPEIKLQVEEIYARCGLTLTDAINIFIQQSINAEGLPFVVTQNTKEALKEQAIGRLMLDLKKGENDLDNGNALPIEEVCKRFGITL